jgi:hypothetical protein
MLMFPCCFALYFIQHTLATLGSGSMLQAVKLPKGEDVNEWLAVNSTFDAAAQSDTLASDRHRLLGLHSHEALMLLLSFADVFSCVCFVGFCSG